MTQMHGEAGHQDRIDIRPYMTSVASLTEYFNDGSGSFEGYVPVSIVERDAHLPFKSERTDELVEDLRQTRERDGWGNGQDSPMLAAYITGEAVPSIEVYDGLHRQVANEVFQARYGIENDRPVSVLAEIGHTAIHFVTAKPMSRRDMLDKRLTNTRNHPELRFARGGLWSAQLWYLDDISTLAPNLSPKQAFSLAARDHAGQIKDGTALGLDEETVEKIVQWAKQRAEDWSVDPSTIYKWIHRAESTTPEIIAKVRNTGKGKRTHGVVTEQMVSSLASFMGDEKLKGSHKLLVDFAFEHELTNIQFSNLVAYIMDGTVVQNPYIPSQISRALDDLDISVLGTDEMARTERRIRRRTDIYTAGPAAIASVSDAIDRVADSLDVRKERSGFVPSVDQKQAAIAAALELEKQAEKALQLAERARQSAVGLGTTALEHHTIPASEFDPMTHKGVLSVREIEIMQLIAQGLSNSEVANGLTLSEYTIKSHLGNIQEKLGAKNRTDAVVRAIMIGAVKVNIVDTDKKATDTDDNSDEHAKELAIEKKLNTVSEANAFNDFENRIRKIFESKTVPSDDEIRELVVTFNRYYAISQRVPKLGKMIEAVIFKARSRK